MIQNTCNHSVFLHCVSLQGQNPMGQRLDHMWFQNVLDYIWIIYDLKQVFTFLRERLPILEKIDDEMT